MTLADFLLVGIAILAIFLIMWLFVKMSQWAAKILAVILIVGIAAYFIQGGSMEELRASADDLMRNLTGKIEEVSE